MRTLPQVILAALELDDRYLAALALAQHLGAHQAAREYRIADLDVAAITDKQDIVEIDR